MSYVPSVVRIGRRNLINPSRVYSISSPALACGSAHHTPTIGSAPAAAFPTRRKRISFSYSVSPSTRNGVTVGFPLVVPGGKTSLSPSILYHPSTIAPTLISSLPPGRNVTIEPSPPNDRCTATHVPSNCA